MNVAIMCCKNIRDDHCPGCHRCLMAFDEKNGEFARYQGDETVKLRAMLHCGGCPGVASMNRLGTLKAWMAQKGESFDALHLGTCLVKHCPHKDNFVEKVKNCGVELVKGTHRY